MVLLLQMMKERKDVTVLRRKTSWLICPKIFSKKLIQLLMLIIEK